MGQLHFGMPQSGLRADLVAVALPLISSRRSRDRRPLATPQPAQLMAGAECHQYAIGSAFTKSKPGAVPQKSVDNRASGCRAPALYRARLLAFTASASTY